MAAAVVSHNCIPGSVATTVLFWVALSVAVPFAVLGVVGMFVHFSCL
jgi:hypothetical protein